MVIWFEPQAARGYKTNGMISVRVDTTKFPVSVMFLEGLSEPEEQEKIYKNENGAIQYLEFFFHWCFALCHWL